ncbi:hypothetical protein PM724_17475 [Erysipelatoclostridium ramosum]|uniref:Uncharacterized protein n=1 Tax=Thomasclavelia ramosa TaxID=1547 RepID=A0AB35IN49_9FIRM|nr:hypothetical protein [Thomasclavelia ramosa]MDB7086066.1 hypothetical protein [Thomasclavelia ramosa]MDB7095699.1 hypothetical protein [Thomasclavelia ramosa]
MKRKYYEVNEGLARTAKSINSFSDYVENTATHEYKYYCDKVYDVLEKIIEQKPNLAEKATYKVDRYCRKLADYYNAYYKNEASCPSILITGAGNFPIKKKNVQNKRREKLHETWKYLEQQSEQIKNLLIMDQPILSKNQDAVELLEEKIAKLEEEHKQKLYWNKYYKKNGTLKGAEGLGDKQIEIVEDFVRRNPSFAPFSVANDTANIRRYKQRLEKMKVAKATGTKIEAINDENNNELFKVVKNTELMRLQLIFTDKPNDEVRTILKKNSFRWSPKNNAWQRQLTENGMFALKRVVNEINKLSKQC